MKTTIELAKQLFAYRRGPCALGALYAEGHPDPLEAISFALTQPTRYGADDPGAFVRHCIEALSTPENRRVYPQASAAARDLNFTSIGETTSPEELGAYTHRAADIVRAWVLQQIEATT